MFGNWEKEVSVIVEIMKELIPLTLEAQEKLTDTQIKDKSDGTIVSICDFASQAIIMDGISKNLPEDYVLGEEDMSKATPEFIAKVKTLLPPNLDPIAACSQAIKSIQPENHRTWVIDPIDGTAGFVNHSSYAIATCLLVDLKPQVSIVAWPLHSKEYTGIELEGPLIFIAYEGGKSFVMDLKGTIKEMPVLKEAEPATTSNGVGPLQIGIKKTFNITKTYSLVSMVKAFILASGKANIYVRCHKKCENTWDVAPFEIFVKNCGGIVTTGKGEPLEYLPSGKIKGSGCIVSTMGGAEFHQKVLECVKECIEIVHHCSVDDLC